MKKLETQPYWAELVSHKDELSLRELSERFGATPGAIMNAFRRNGIKRQDAPPGPRKHRKNKPLPPEPGESGAAVTAQLGDHARLLGTVPDIEVAKKSGLSLRTVSAYRVSQGIPGFAGKASASRSAGGKAVTRQARAPKKPGRKSKIDAFASEVGTTTDRVIATKAGVTINAVRNWRRVHKVPAFAGDVAGATGAAPAPVAKAAARRGAGSAGYAWRVVLVGGASGIVVAANIAEAAQQAAGVGDAQSIERVGALLA